MHTYESHLFHQIIVPCARLLVAEKSYPQKRTRRSKRNTVQSKGNSPKHRMIQFRPATTECDATRCVTTDVRDAGISTTLGCVQDNENTLAVEVQIGKEESSCVAFHPCGQLRAIEQSRLFWRLQSGDDAGARLPRKSVNIAH